MENKQNETPQPENKGNGNAALQLLLLIGSIIAAIYFIATAF